MYFSFFECVLVLQWFKNIFILYEMSKEIIVSLFYNSFNLAHWYLPIWSQLCCVVERKKKTQLISDISRLRYVADTTLMAESEEELNSLLMSVKEESAKAGLKVNIRKIKIMASGPITSWQIEGEKVEAVTLFFSWTPKSLWMVTVAMKWKHIPCKESYDKPRQHIKKHTQRSI